MKALLPSSLVPQRLPALVLVVLVLHGVALWLARSGLLRNPSVEPLPALQLSVVMPPLTEARPAVEPAPTPPRSAPVAARAPAVQPVQPVQPARAPVAEPAPTPVAAAAPQAAAATAGVAAPAAPAAAGQAVNAAPVSAVNGQAHGSGAGAGAARVELPTDPSGSLKVSEDDYPLISRRRNEQGRVLLSIYVGADGLVQKAEVKVSSGSERLDRKAVTLAQGRQLTAGRRGGLPEAMWIDWPFEFRLRD